MQVDRFSFESFFTTRRLKSDTLLWAAGCACALMRTAKVSRRLASIASAATSAFSATPSAAKQHLAVLLPSPPTPKPPSLAVCTWQPASLLTPGVHSDLLALLLCMASWEYGSRLMLLVCAAGPCLLLARSLAPTWYHQGGRTLLVSTIRVAPRLVALLELLLLPHQLATRAWLRACFLSPHSLLSAACLAVLLPVPLLAHAAVSLMEACLFAAALASSQRGPLPPLHVVPLVLQYALVCVLLPSGILATIERRARASYRHRHQPPTHAAAQRSTATSVPALPDLQPPSKGRAFTTQAATPADLATPCAAAPSATPAATGHDCSQGVPALPAALSHPGVEGAVPAIASAAAAAGALAGPHRASPLHYRAKLRVRLASVKIQHHNAYQHRHAIGTAVEAALLACPTLHPPPCATPPRCPLALHTVALEGCLQLLVTVTDFPDDAPLSSGSETSTPPPSPTTLDALHEQVEACLPDWARDSPLTVDVLSRSTSAAPTCTPPTGPPTTAAAPPATPAPAPGPQQPQQQPEPAVQLQPLCVQAGAQEWQELLVGPSAASGWRWELGAVPEVVVVCSCRGEELVLRHVPAEADCAMEGFRVRLPPDLDPAPINIHLLAPPPAPPGTLLATVATAALPSAPCSELLALPLVDAEMRASAAALLHDLAAALHLMAARGAACLPAIRPAADDMLDFFYAAGLPACTAFLHRRLAAAANQRPPQPPPPAPAPGAFAAAHPPPGAAGPSPDAAAATAAGAAAVANPSAVGAAAAAAAPPPTPLAAADDSWPEGSAAHAAGPLVPAANGCGPAAANTAAERTAPAARDAAPSKRGRRPRAGGGLALVPACVVRAAAAVVGPAARLEGEQRERYAERRVQQGRTEGVWAVAVCALCTLVHVGKVIVVAGLPRAAWPRMFEWAAVQLACIALPALVLEWGPSRVRAWRNGAALVQYVLRCGSYLAAARCWLVNPKMSQALLQPMPTALLGFGVLLPALSRAHWAVQLAAGLLLEELPRYVMLQSAACPADPTPGPQRRTAGSLLQVALLPCVAAACGWVMDRRARAAFLRLSQPAARPATAPHSKTE